MELKKDYFIKCISKKKTANINADYIKNLGRMIEGDYGKHFRGRLEKRSLRIKNCLSYWEWNLYKKNKVLDLRTVYRCKDMFCPNCRSWNGAKSVVKFVPVFSDLILKGYSPYFMTLTVPNIEGEELGNEIDRLNKGFAKIWKWLNRSNGNGGHREGFKGRLFDAVGAIRIIELTVNSKTRLFNVHIHALIFLDDVNENNFIKMHEGGYRIKSDEIIYYSDADLFIQKLWTMAYKNISIREFNKRSDYWKDNFVCDIRPLEMEKGLYEVFKYCFKDVNILDINIFKNLFLGIMNRRTRQGYGELFKFDKDIEDEINDDNIIENYLEFDEEPEILKVRAISEMVLMYEDYKKISRFKSEEEINNIKD